MRRKYSRLLTFIIAFSMILSMHVTFAQPEGSDANQVSSWINYFDVEGLIGEKYEPVDTPWVVVAPPDGYEYYAIIVKAGSDQSTDGQSNKVITGGIEVGDEIYFTWDDDGKIKNKEISHIIAIFVPIEEPWEGKIIIDKSFVGETDYDFDDVIFTLTGPDNYNETESPDPNGDAVFSGLAVGTYTLTENSLDGITSSLPANGLDIELPKDADNDGEYNVSVTNTVDDEPWEGKIIIYKSFVGETDYDFDDVVFTLTGPDNYNETESPDINGEAVFSGLAAGTYTLTENGLDGITSSLPENGKQITLPDDADDNDEYKVSVTNTVDGDDLGRLKVHKRIMKENDSIVAALGDGEFTVTLEGPIGEEGSTTRTGVITNQGSQYTFNNLPFGTYKLLETEIDHEGETYGDPIYATSGNQNYEEVDNENILINSTGEEEIWVINVPEEPWEGNLRIVKTFTDQTDPEGIEFTLTGPDEETWTAVTDESGEAEFTNLPEGSYNLSEDTPDGYVSSLGEDGRNFTLPGDYNWEENDFFRIVRVTNTPEETWEGNLRIVKTFTDESDPEGITFTLTGPDEETWTAVTDESGEAEFTNLPEGSYNLSEDTPDGYVSSLGEDGRNFTLPGDYNWEENDFFRTVRVTNTPEDEAWEGTIRIEKSVDDPRDSTPELDGFTFRLYQIIEDEEVLVGSRTTGESGIVSFTELEEGDYILYENNSPLYIEGIDSDGLEITLPDEDMEDDVLTIEVENTRRYTPPEGDDDDDDDDDDIDDDDDDDDDDIDDDDDDDDTDTPEVESETVTPDPIPQAPPVVETVQPEQESEQEPEIEVMEEPVPLATLPKTGASDPTVFAGLGAALMAFGAFLKRRKDG